MGMHVILANNRQGMHKILVNNSQGYAYEFGIKRRIFYKWEKCCNLLFSFTRLCFSKDTVVFEIHRRTSGPLCRQLLRVIWFAFSRRSNSCDLASLWSSSSLSLITCLRGRGKMGWATYRKRTTQRKNTHNSRVLAADFIWKKWFGPWRFCEPCIVVAERASVGTKREAIWEWVMHTQLVSAEPRLNDRFIDRVKSKTTEHRVWSQKYIMRVPTEGRKI